jgi:hypothetical protein
MATHALASRRKRQPAVRNIRRLRVNMTLEAHEPALFSQEQHAIHRAVRRVARRTALCLHRCVFKDVGTSFFRMTLHADFPVCIPQHDLVTSSV